MDLRHLTQVCRSSVDDATATLPWQQIKAVFTGEHKESKGDFFKTLEAFMSCTKEFYFGMHIQMFKQDLSLGAGVQLLTF